MIETSDIALVLVTETVWQRYTKEKLAFYIGSPGVSNPLGTTRKSVEAIRAFLRSNAAWPSL